MQRCRGINNCHTASATLSVFAFSAYFLPPALLSPELHISSLIFICLGGQHRELSVGGRVAAGIAARILERISRNYMGAITTIADDNKRLLLIASTFAALTSEG